MFQLIAAITIVTIVLLIKYRLTYWSRRGVKGPLPIPMFGNMFQYFLNKKHFGEVYDDLYRLYPCASYIGIFKFGTPALIIKNLDIVKSVLIDHFSHFEDNDFHVDKKFDPLLAKNPFFSSGKQWRKNRNKLAPSFTPDKLKEIFPLVKIVCDKFSKFIEREIESKKDIETKELCLKFTIETVASVSFGFDSDAFSNSDSIFVEHCRKIFRISTMQTIRLTAIIFFPFLGNFINLSFLPHRVDKWLRSIINDTIKKREQLNEYRTDFLQQILDERKKCGLAKYDESTVVGNALTFLLDGFETSSILMSYCLYELAVNPEIQRRLQDDVDAVLKDTNGELTHESLLKLHFLENVLLETLRMHPPLLAINRLCTKEFQLPPQYPDTHTGIIIKPGTPVIIPVHSIHSDPDIYENPKYFNPDRFTEIGRLDFHKCSFFGFGHGPRMCPGLKFGLMQNKAAIATIISKYWVELSPKTNEPLKFSKQTLMKTSEEGVWIQLKNRCG